MIAEQEQRVNGEAVTEDGEILDQVLQATEATLDKRESAMIEMQLASAMKRPRSIEAFIRRATEYATVDEETADDCSYSVPRGGKKMVGPSIRLAEICAMAWGNLHFGTRIVDIGDKFITAGAECWDMETNARAKEEVCRSVMTSAKSGTAKRFSDDMIVVTLNAAKSIALRNAIFRIIPRALVERIRRKCVDVVRGTEKTLAARRKALVEYFFGKGVSEARVCAAVGKKGIDDIGLDELVTLKGYATAIKDGEVKIEDCFPDPSKPQGGSLADKIKGKAPESPPSDPTPAMSDLEKLRLVVSEEFTRIGSSKTVIATMLSAYKATAIADLTEGACKLLIAELGKIPTKEGGVGDD